MTAYRVIDDHKELDNIGSNTHDQIDAHINTAPFVIVSGAAGNIPPSARLLSGSGITISDGGPGGNLTLTLVGSGTPSGNNSEVQFNDGGSFGSDSNFTFNKTTNTLTVNNLSGSLTRLIDGTSYLVAGSNITITSSSNGSVTISGQSGDITSVVAGLGLLGGGTSGVVTLDINDSIVATTSGSIFTGVTKHNSGLSGSLTRLVDGTSYLVAGNNIIITSASNGSVTINSTASGTGTPGGLDTYIQFNDGSTFGGDANFTFNKTTNTLSVSNVSGSLTKLTDGSSYLIAGSNVTITTGSNGAITIAVPSVAPTNLDVLVSWMEIPTGDADGVNMVYTLSNTPDPVNSLMFYVNGVLQLQGASYDYDLSGGTVIMNYSPSSGSNIVATYSYTTPPPAGSSTAWMEIPSGLANGINNIFTLVNTPYPLTSLMFYVNGVLQRQGVSYDYTITGNTVTMNYIPNSGSNIVATYPY